MGDLSLRERLVSFGAAQKRKHGSEAAEDEAFLAVDNIHLRFGGVRAITGVSFEVRRGDISSIISPPTCI